MDALPVFYCDAMVAETASFSPSPGKPRDVMISWLAKGYPIEVIVPAAATREDLCRAHDADYIEGVLSCRKGNGFGTRDARVAESLPFTSGSMLSAARKAISTGGVAVSPSSGFHHAAYAHGGGYCTFNGLMVTALALKQEGLIERIGILDFDQHYGDGTVNIIERLGLDWVNHYTAGEHYDSPTQAAAFLLAVSDIVGRMSDCDVVLYQAGADPHIADPLGGWLTTDQLHMRDRLVFETVAAMGLPVAWNLAGGYQTPLQKVLDIHDNTMRECVSVFASGP